jgi:hypothetical protein
VDEFDLSPERAEALRRAAVLSRKINLLLETIKSDSGKPFSYKAICDGARESGYYISRTRWSLLKAGKVQVVSDECLRALAAVFDVNPAYLLQEDGPLPGRIKAELMSLRSRRRAEVLNVAVDKLRAVDPEALRAVVKILNENWGAEGGARV